MANAPLDFFGPFLKVERANEHIGELNRLFTAHIRANEKAMRRQRYKDGKPVPIKLGTSFPRHTPTVIGDAIHNLRASLDHAYCLLVESNGHTPDDKTYFPFGADRQSVEGSINGHKKRGVVASDLVVDFIMNEIEPFKGGRKGLYGLHLLDRTDKHKVLIPTTINIYIQRLEIRNPDGSIRNVISNLTLAMPQENQSSALLGLQPGQTVNFQGNFQTAFEVCFEEGQPFEGESVINTLSALAQEVRSVLIALRKLG